MKELDVFTREGFAEYLDSGHIGVDSLRSERLPCLLKDRIRTFLPDLEKEINTKRKNSESI